MSADRKKFYVTTPIYYVNARPHIGHAYTTIVADVLARRHRLLGDETFFLTGTDEHGQKIERSAAAAGIPPQQFADEVSASFESLWKRMGITNDRYIRTTDPKHAAGVQKLFSELYARGFIELRNYTGAYCVSDETFVDAPAGTPCPDCGRILETVTEENFFFKLSEFQRPLLDLIETGTIKIEPESRKNEVLSFLRGNMDLALLHPKLSSVVANNIDELYNAAYHAGLLGRTKSGSYYLFGALKDLSISRSSFTWGIPVPEPAASAAKQKHVIYVWLDALANYMTAIGYGSNTAADAAEFAKFWPADLHLVGKEIIRFHCVYWPAFLLAAGIPLPKAITAHGWLLFDNSKMSKSKGNIVRTETVLDAFGALCPASLPSADKAASLPAGDGTAEAVPLTHAFKGKYLLSVDAAMPSSEATDQVPQGFSLGSHGDKKEEGALAPGTALKGTGFSPSVGAPIADAALAAEGTHAEPSKAERDLFAADVLRYFLLREIPFGQDGSFSFDAMITRYNADLANGYGNLVSRTLNLISQSCGGTIPEHEPFLPRSFVMGPSTPSTFFAGLPPVITVHGPLLAEQTAALCIVYDRAFKELLFTSQVDENSGRTEKGGAINVAQNLVALTDGFVTQKAPWKLAKSSDQHERKELQDTLYTAAESIRIITALLYPILPYATARVWAQLGLGDIEQAAREGKLKDLQWGGLKPGTKLGPLGPIFPRADKGLAQIMTDMENNNASPSGTSTPDAKSSFDPGAAPRTSSLDSLAEPSGVLPVAGSGATTTRSGLTPSHTEALPSGPFASVASQTPVNAAASDSSTQITIDDFAKVELRVAQIVVAERIPKADKLLRLEVDLGPEMPKRQILSGIAEWYAPEDLVGRRIVVITNLAPRKMRGFESHGMLLAASNGENGKPVLATFGEDIALGSRLK